MQQNSIQYLVLLVGLLKEMLKKIVKIDSVVHGKIKCNEISQDLSFPKIKKKNVHINKNRNTIKMNDACHKTILDTIFERH